MCEITASISSVIGLQSGRRNRPQICDLGPPNMSSKSIVTIAVGHMHGHVFKQSGHKIQ
jgi:hypothetical protein